MAAAQSAHQGVGRKHTPAGLCLTACRQRSQPRAQHASEEQRDAWPPTSSLPTASEHPAARIPQTHCAFCLQMSGVKSVFAHEFTNSQIFSKQKINYCLTRTSLLFLWITWNYYTAINIKSLSHELHFWVKVIFKFLFPKHTTYFNILMWTPNYYSLKTIFLLALAKMH